ncbi:MAG: hypothetical protein JRC68_08385 [Deltaproteobacteria bacterium]|nr:hypothetical protein [Deltaproteobacteria bacterium]
MKPHNFLMIMLGLVALALLSPLCQPISAQEEEIPQLRQKIVELEARVKQLEALLKGFNEPEEKQEDKEAGWQNKKNWRILKLGMTEAQVRTVLGEPIKAIKGVKTLWYYPNIYCSYVSFDKDGRLIGWNEP